ncbi:hypothetical protein MOQ_003845 [Trypanosoma cruzi marinkellei]|uniref:U3 small nucleolar RNA-associated protein 20 domain-containing protein n=1 Tax=Trypanosoma cruzi marinkellei TaxID=85056 RepID=K2NTK7_TRYCR|nr:hypothetical protein MOQ_003845 [Trypanosoma cruzi marinkellei]
MNAWTLPGNGNLLCSYWQCGRGGGSGRFIHFFLCFYFHFFLRFVSSKAPALLLLLFCTMPPKKRGQNTRGRDKIFRNAVQHVHVGVGHSVLGDIVLRPVAGLVSRTGVKEDDNSACEECAFLMELNELMLSHSTTDFKRFRWEVLELCESKALFRLNHRRIAEKLLLCLMRRDKFAEGFEAFVRLTVAFARDMQEKFLAYFECFHQAINGGILNAKGQLMADTRRLQLIFAAQVAWCREMRPFWLLQGQRKLVERIIRLYVRQMHDKKEYIRRLSAEVLASVCRMVRDLVPLVVEEACLDVVQDFEVYCANSMAAERRAPSEANNDDGAKDGEEEEEEEEEEGEEDENYFDGDSTKALKSRPPVISSSLLQAYEQSGLVVLPVVDGLCFLAAEMFRGIRGSLSTNFENHYVLLAHVFGISWRTQFAGTYCSGRGMNEQEMFGFTEEEAQNFIHATRWTERFMDARDEKEMAGESQRGEMEEVEVVVMKELVQMIGGVVIGSALRMMVEETSTSSFAAGNGAGDEEKEKEEERQGVRASSLQMLRTVTVLLEFSLPHAHLLGSLLHAADYKLLRDPSATSTLRQTSETLLEKARLQIQTISKDMTNTKALKYDDWCRIMRTCGGILEMFTPLCVGPTALSSHAKTLQGLFSPLAQEILMTCLSVSGHHRHNSHSACDTSAGDWDDLRRLTKRMLFAFVQDVLQKNYTFFLRDERRLIEEEKDPSDKGHMVVTSYLSPFALFLLVPVLHSACVDANTALDCAHSKDKTLKDVTSVSVMREVTHAVMMARMMCDRTTHLVKSPLYSALTTNVSPSAFISLAASATFSEAANSSLINRDAFTASLQNFLHGVLVVFANAQEGTDEESKTDASKWADVVSAILPIVLTVVDAEKAMKRMPGKSIGTADSGKTPFMWLFRDALLRAIRGVKSIIVGNRSNNKNKDKKKKEKKEEQQQTLTPLTRLTAASYSLFAQASTLLVQLDTLTGELDSKNMQVECVGFLKDAVIVLAASFQNRHVKELNDEETGRLLHGMECLLLSLLRLFGVELERDAEATVASSKKARVKSSTGTGERTLLTATSRLHGALDMATQRALVETLLLEALASPVHSLRVVAIRLLRLLCHPSVAEAERTAGCCAIDTSFFDALLSAELFDPLSAAGNLDGVRQALAKLTFEVAAGTLRNPIQRVILAHAMVGLLHTRFAEAHPIALKMLADLVRMENTSAPVLKRHKGRDLGISGEGNHPSDGNTLSLPTEAASSSSSLGKKLEPLVWRGVICRYARAVVFGDIVRRADAEDFNDEEDEKDDDGDVAAGGGGGSAYARGRAIVWYRICLTDMQRHEKGELVSKEFATARSAFSTVALLQLANTDGELLSWRRHYLPSASPTHTHGAITARTTDRAVLAKTFLSGLSEMTRGAIGDERVSLVADLVLELSAVRRGEHPDGLRQLKMLDDRLVLAMNACYVTPVSSLNERFPADVRSRLVTQNELLQTMCVGLLSDSNTKLQRAAIDLLQRLKVLPFSSHHAQLISYCDTQKNLFHFLSTFHIETDIPEEDKADYIATAIAIVLPKLTAKVSKEKLKDQAILQRRVLAMVTHLSATGEFAQVLEGIVQRLIFERVISSGTMDSAAVRFPEMWAEWVENNSHCARRLERLVKQLLNTMQLLHALLQSVGKGFESFAGSCMYLSLNAYLVSCKQILQAPLGEDTMCETEKHWRIRKVLSSSTLNTLLPKLRRTSAGMVSSLFEQFPSEVMTALRKDLVEVSGGDVAQSLISRYVSMLHENSNGVISEFMSTQRAGDGHKTGVTPLLRLVRAWVESPFTMPLIGTFGDTVTAMFMQVFGCNAMNHTMKGSFTNAVTASSSVSTSLPLQQASTLSIYEGLRCVGIILASSDESFDIFGAPGSTTLQNAYIKPHVMTIFGSLYRLIVRGTSSSAFPQSFSGTGRLGATHKKRNSSSVMTFSVPMWKEMIATVTMLSEYVVVPGATEDDNPEDCVDAMLSRLLEMCIAFVAHPASAKDRQTCITAANMLEGLLPRMRHVGLVEHFEPLVRLFNVVTCPEARLALCRALSMVLSRLVCPVDFHLHADKVKRGSVAHMAQMAAVGRAVTCLNAFAEDNTELERYDFELRFHTFRSLRQFFAHNGNYGALPAKHQRTGEGLSSNFSSRTENQVRHEREYSGTADVTIPLDKAEAPVLCVEAFFALTANVMFFLRDPEGTIRVLAAQLLDAMILYASRQKDLATSYDTMILEHVIRREILPSLRRGITSRDVHIRHAHMQSFSALARYYPQSFSSFAALHSRNVERCFFANVGHVQHRCRVKALELLRQNVGRLLPRDLLRVFVPFLLVAVKDFAQGKRDLQNLTEGRAKGYCDAVLTTVATLAAALPWEGYYRVLSLFMQNARENASLRLPMLRGVVMMLDHFHFLNNDGADGNNNNTNNNNSGIKCVKKGQVGDADIARSATDASADAEDDDEEDEDEDEAAAALRAKRIKYRHAHVIHVMEDDILPQLYEFLGNDSRKAHPIDNELRGNVHTITSVRHEMRKADNAQQKTAILQLPVAIAITKIVKRFPPERFSLHVEHLLDEVILKLRTKSDKHRESARKILSAMLCETGPGKIAFVITKLRDHLVHGYQLHVLGYTVVTLLYNLYEPQHAISYRRKKHVMGAEGAAAAAAKGTTIEHAGAAFPQGDNDNDDDKEKVEQQSRAEARQKETTRENDEDADAEEEEEEELVRQLIPASNKFDWAYGVECLTSCLDNLMSIFLDDYLGEVGEQKEQVELMSTMVEVKRNRALQGFTLIASHCEARRVIEVFLEKITWLLTPPSTADTVDVSTLRGSARAAALLLQELKTKYSTVSKNAAADFVFVQKVRLLAVRFARALIKNATMEVESSFLTVRDLLRRHNEVREEKIKTFEAKDGTRRIRGNVHLTIQRAPTATRKDQLDSNFLVDPRPERVDVDFSAHTVLATQQRQKLRAYRGRYGKEVQQAAKNFYREDPATAVVLDTLDEFLLKYLLSVLKHVLGIGKERKYTTAAVRLDLLRAQRKKMKNMKEENSFQDDDDEEEDGDDDVPEELRERGGKEENEEEGEEEEGGDTSLLDPQPLDDERGDALDRFATAAQQENEAWDKNAGDTSEQSQTTTTTKKKKETCHVHEVEKRNKTRRPMADLTTSFTRQHQQLLESLFPVVLTTLQGEGSDAVVGNALDCMLALVSLRPPLHAVGALHTTLYDTVTAFFERGGAIKQRAMRVAAAVVAHQRFILTEEKATQLLQLCRTELVDRNEFLPMALSLFHAVLGKHIHVVEVYDLIGVVTELMMHTSAKRLLRQRCIAVLARFLTEYRITPEKFRSHMDLFCRNLDYPEVTGRIAILELLGVLVYRLPTALLRQEAPLLLIPLAVTLAVSEFYEARQKAGDVLQSLVKNAGVDVIVPTLSQWLAAGQKRPRKAMALQTWAVMIPAVAASYDMSVDEDASEFETCWSWSLQALLEAATFDQVATFGTKRKYEELTAEFKRKLELKSWTYVFFALRCLEGIATVAPVQVWQNMSVTPHLLPFLSGRLVLHSHPWIQSVALRLLRMYCHDGVERRCGYLRGIDWVAAGHLVVTSKKNHKKGKKGKSGVGGNVHSTQRASSPVVSHSQADKDDKDDGCIPYVVCFHESLDPPDTVYRALNVLDEMAAAMRTLLQFIALSDVPNEKYNAHRAMQQPSRTDAVNVALYISRAMFVVSMVLLKVAVFDAGSGMSYVQDIIAQHFTSLRHQLHSLVKPVIKHGGVANVMVRTTSLVQYFGGFLAALPTDVEADDTINRRKEEEDGGRNEPDGKVTFREASGATDLVTRAVCWLARNAVGLHFVRDTIIPTLSVAMRCGDRSEKLSALAIQASTMVREQLERHHAHFGGDFKETTTTTTTKIIKTKRKRLEKNKMRRDETNALGKETAETSTTDDVDGDALTVDDVLFTLTAAMTAVRTARKEKTTRRDTLQTLRKRGHSGGDDAAPLKARRRIEK